MPNDKQNQSPQDLAKSWVALNTLRDYVYQQKPHKLLATDFVEDIPSLRPFGSAFSNVLPSAAIISSDPHERKQQISEAVRRVNKASKKDHPVFREALRSAATFGLGSIPLSLAFGLAEKSIHVPGLRKLIRGEKPRISFKENFQTPEKKRQLRNYLQDSVAAGVGQGALFGAAPVLASSSIPFKKEHLDAASKVLNEHPNISSLPGADMAALNNNYKDKNVDPTNDHIKNILSGAATAGTATLAGQGLIAANRFRHNVMNPVNDVAANHLYNTVMPKIRNRLRGKSNGELGGTGLRGSGGPNRRMTGVLTKRLKNLKPQKQPFFTKEHILEPVTWKGMKKPLLAFSLLGAGLSGLGSYMTHPAHKNE